VAQQEPAPELETAAAMAILRRMDRHPQSPTAMGHYRWIVIMELNEPKIA